MHSADMRMYTPIWNRIKTKNTASIATSPDNAARVIRAVKKEKVKDKGFALMLSREAKIARLQITKEIDAQSVSNLITIHFSLTITIKEEYIEVDNL